LVHILRSHLDEFGTAADGRLFRNEDGQGHPIAERVFAESNCP
jgi:hypothetical protein